MDTKYKIAIPDPCHADWNKMTTTESGKFCNNCAKNVVDFTNMNPSQIQAYFIANKKNSICGRFKNEQIDSVIIKIPSQALFSHVPFHKQFLLALLISMGTTLFSCVDQNGNKQKIDGVEVVKDTANVDNETLVGLVMPNSNDSLQPKPKINEVKFIKTSTVKITKAHKPIEKIPYEETTMGKPVLVTDTITK